ncbi:MAG: MtaA/CmuA family methyltransferase [Clostridia bacterium]|jgi:[methyl-Co(III) methanol-specific corrinoid protein]:coenzyme M methyltransferase|nr:MtaA/CmuA family methyltransferase [Clostridia bacterium]MBT7122352.1 MtaA/CmuA family methyltransferase [Clostridia bacterium]
MNSFERVRAIIDGDDFDRPAVIAPVSIATYESCKALGIDFAKAHQGPEAAAALAVYPHLNLGFDSAMPYFSVVLEAAALGETIDWGSDLDMPAQKYLPGHYAKDFDMPGDFLDRAPIKAMLDAIKLIRKKHGSEVFIFGKVMGAWTLGLHLCGTENFLIDTLIDKERVHYLLGKYKQITQVFAQAQLCAGADMITMADHITGDLASRETYVEFLQPIHRNLLKQFDKTTFVLHCCGKTLDRIPLFNEAGFDLFHFESKNDAGKAIELAGDMMLTGNINIPDTLYAGAPDDVGQEVTQILKSGIKLISPECALPLQTRNENLLAISQTVINRNHQ